MRRMVSLSIVLAMLLVAVVSPVCAAQGIYEPLQIQNIAEIESVLDFYKPNSNVDYTVTKQKTLKSLSDGDDAYTLYELSPYGYAIFFE